MKKLFAIVLAVLFTVGALLGCGKTPSTELNQARQQATDQVTKAAQSGLEKLHGKQAQPKIEEGRVLYGQGRGGFIYPYLP